MEEGQSDAHPDIADVDIFPTGNDATVYSQPVDVTRWHVDRVRACRDITVHATWRFPVA